MVCALPIIMFIDISYDKKTPSQMNLDIFMT